MTDLVLKFISLLSTALVTGAMFGIWLGYNPVHFSAPAYLEYQQNAIRGLNVSMPVLGLISVISTIVLVFAVKGRQPATYLLIASVAFLVAAGIITRFFNQPINSHVITWILQTMPADWTALRDKWWHWHILRMSAGMAGLGLLIIAIIADGKTVR